MTWKRYVCHDIIPPSIYNDDAIYECIGTHNISMQLCAVSHLDALDTRLAAVNALLVQDIGHCRVCNDFSAEILRATNL